MAINVNNGNGVLAAYQYAGKAQKTSVKETTFAEKVAETGSTQELLEAEKLEAFKKEIWNEINSMPWDNRMNISIQITDKAFERMMNDTEFKDKMMGLIKEECLACHPPGDTSLTWIDENGYKGYAYIDIESGHAAFSSHSKDKNSFFVKKSTKQDLNDIWEEELLERELQQELRDKEYFEHKRLTEYWNKRQSAAASYESNVLTEPVESSGFDSAITGTIV